MKPMARGPAVVFAALTLLNASCATDRQGLMPQPFMGADRGQSAAEAETSYRQYRIEPSLTGGRIGLRLCDDSQLLDYLRSSGANLDFEGLRSRKKEDDWNNALMAILMIPIMVAASQSKEGPVLLGLAKGLPEEIGKASRGFNRELRDKLGLKPLNDWYDLGLTPWTRGALVTGPNASIDDWVMASQIRRYDGDLMVNGQPQATPGPYMEFQGEPALASRFRGAQHLQLGSTLALMAAGVSAIWWLSNHYDYPNASTPVLAFSALSLSFGVVGVGVGNHETDRAREEFNKVIEGKVRARIAEGR